jgi:hypothetical protein
VSNPGIKPYLLSFLSPLSPVSGEFPFFLGLLDSEFVPTAAIREILIVFLPVLLPAGGRKESRGIVVEANERRDSPTQGRS